MTKPKIDKEVKQVKLTNGQKSIIELLSGGTPIFYNPITPGAPCTIGDYGDRAMVQNIRPVLALEKAGLIKKHRINPAMYEYHLTDLGKTLEL